MRKPWLLVIFFFLVAFTGDSPYKNGTFSGMSRSIYTYEPFYGKASITIENGKITQVDFIIRDSLKHENFDAQYEKYFQGNDEYIQQCRNDWKGVQSYPDSLVKYQKIGDVDAITGATWSYNIFKASAEIALEKAK
jgi:major membrane immunogen (membrane-anchored lipoprotein)